MCVLTKRKIKFFSALIRRLTVNFLKIYVSLRLIPSAGEFVEHFLVQRLVVLLGAHRHEDVTADELVHHFAVAGEAGKDDVLAFELDHHVLHFPVDVPGLKIKISLI